MTPIPIQKIKDAYRQALANDDPYDVIGSLIADHDVLMEIMDAAKAVEADHEIRATVLVSSVSQYKLLRLQRALAAAEGL